MKSVFLALIYFGALTATAAAEEVSPLSKWMNDYNSCFNSAVTANRKSLNVSATQAKCKKEIQTRYQLKDADADFVVSVHPISSTQNKIELAISSSLGSKEVKIYYNGVCTNLENPVKQAQMTAKEISDKLIADLNLNPEISVCQQEDWEKEKVGFTWLEGRCVRVCLDNEIMTSQMIGNDGQYKTIFSCTRCTDYMREYQERSGEKKTMDYGIVYAHTSSDTNRCEDFNTCNIEEEFKGGKCLKKCRENWVRNTKTLKCEKGPRICQDQFAEANQAIQERYSQRQASLRSTSFNDVCRQAIVRSLGQIHTAAMMNLQRELTECQRDKTSDTHIESYFSIESKMDQAQQTMISNLCGISVEEFRLIMDPPATYERHLDEY